MDADLDTLCVTVYWCIRSLLPRLSRTRPTPGGYALSKVLEEVMLEQYGVQYALDFCCLRAPWIMEKDDLRYQALIWGRCVRFARWRDLVEAVGVTP